MAKIAVIIGAAQETSRRTAELFAEAEYRLGQADLREPVETKKAVQAAGVEATSLVGDISNGGRTAIGRLCG